MTDKQKPSKPYKPSPPDPKTRKAARDKAVESRVGPSKVKSSPSESGAGSFKTAPAPAARSTLTPRMTAAVPMGLSAEVAERLTALDSEFGSVQSQAGLSEHHQAMADLDQGIAVLEERVAEIRLRGYVYKNFLERKIETLRRKWEAVRPSLLARIEQEDLELSHLCDSATQSRTAIAAGGVSATELGAFEAQIQSVKTRVNTAEAAIQAIYSGIRETYYQTNQQISELIGFLDEMEQATFPVLAGEGPIQAVKAKWWRDRENEGPQGYLYLTDQRLIFEQKEEVATKKVLFITTDKEMVRQLLFEAPIGSIQSVKASARGLLGNQDHLDCEFGAGAPYDRAHFHIDGQDSEEWAALIKRVQTGDIQSECVQRPGDPASASSYDADRAASNAPSRCTACGASFDTPIAHGQRQIICEYCGTTMRW